MRAGRVLITGGTGSLGTHILATAERERWDTDFIVYSRDEAKQARLRERFPAVECVLGDIRDRGDLTRAMRGCDVVVHTAAYKRVPEAERQSKVCIDANVYGSLNVALAALANRVEHVVGISTDKACSPINTYGQSKALMERLWQSFARESRGTQFHLTRYGNVIASNGSVIPLWRKQASEGKPVTVTFPDMTRFWLTLDDAVDLIVASLDTPSGDILIPACPSSTMAVLAEAVAPGVEQTTIGSRGGERMHERLICEEEAPYTSGHRMGYLLGPLSSAVRDEMPDGWVLSSSTTKRLTSDRLRAVVDDLDAGTETRLLG